jgi:tetratricopeptide (TPR) repeat protein
MVIARVVNRRLRALLLAGAALLASQPVSAQTVVDNGSALGSNNRSAGTISDADLRELAASMDDGRAALKRNKLRGAIQLFTKVLKYPENEYSAEAKELLGLALQRGGQIAEAQATYEDFLRRYPAGEESDRVRQRLAGILTAIGEANTPLRAPPTGQFAPVHDTTWTFVANASTFYIRDDSFRTARDSSTAPDPTADPDSHAVHQNEILTTLDWLATWNNDETKGRIRFSGGEEHRFDSNQDANQVDETGVSVLSVDATVKDWNLRTVAGRQTYNSDGVLGRFDGALFSWQPVSLVKFDLVTGSPANSRYDAPFKNERYFYGAGIGIGPLFGGLETSIYAIEQRDRWLVDREAIGSELRYADANKFAFGTVDYDVHFQRLNAIIASGSWTLPDGSTLYGGADYRRTPYLSSWNALINQPFGTLYDLLRNQAETSQQLQQIAYDSTPIYKSAMLGFSHPLSDKLQVGADATLVNLSQPIAPIGLDPSLATLAAGNEYYFSAQLIGNNIFKDGDMYIGALRYSQQETDTDYVLDLNSRYPINSDWTIGPRLRLGYSTFSGTNIRQYTALPSFFLLYHVTENLDFESEVGAQWTSATQPGVNTKDTELFVTMGLRYKFEYDGSKNAANDHSKLVTPATAALCRYSTRPEGGNCVAPSWSSR